MAVLLQEWALLRVTKQITNLRGGNVAHRLVRRDSDFAGRLGVRGGRFYVLRLHWLHREDLVVLRGFVSSELFHVKQEDQRVGLLKRSQRTF